MRMAHGDPSAPRSAEILPKAVEKRLRGLAHHLASWEEVLRAAVLRADQERLEAELRPHVEHCFSLLPAPGEGGEVEMRLELRVPVAEPNHAWVWGGGPAAAMSPAGRALLHLPGLRQHWASVLRGSLWEDLRRRLLRAWVVDPQPLPPSAAIAGLGIARWADLPRLRQTGRCFEVGGEGGRTVLGDEQALEVWKTVGERLQAAVAGRCWVSELGRGAGVRELSARYVLNEGRWELASISAGS